MYNQNKNCYYCCCTVFWLGFDGYFQFSFFFLSFFLTFEMSFFSKYQYCICWFNSFVYVCFDCWLIIYNGSLMNHHHHHLDLFFCCKHRSMNHKKKSLNKTKQIGKTEFLKISKKFEYFVCQIILNGRRKKKILNKQPKTLNSKIHFLKK